MISRINQMVDYFWRAAKTHTNRAYTLYIRQQQSAVWIPSSKGRLKCHFFDMGSLYITTALPDRWRWELIYRGDQQTAAQAVRDPQLPISNQCSVPLSARPHRHVFSFLFSLGCKWEVFGSVNVSKTRSPSGCSDTEPPLPTVDHWNKRRLSPDRLSIDSTSPVSAHHMVVKSFPVFLLTLEAAWIFSALDENNGIIKKGEDWGRQVVCVFRTVGSPWNKPIYCVLFAKPID